MNYQIKQQIFDVLNEGGIISDYNSDLPSKPLRYTSNSADRGHDINHSTYLPDDIETKMLDYLEKQHSKGIYYSIHNRSKCVNLMVEDINAPYYFPSFFFDWVAIPRPVAIAQACCFVYKQLKVNDVKN